MALFIRRSASVNIKIIIIGLWVEQRNRSIFPFTLGMTFTLITLLQNESQKKIPWQPASLSFPASLHCLPFSVSHSTGIFFPPGTAPSVITMVYAQQLTVHKLVILYKYLKHNGFKAVNSSKNPTFTEWDWDLRCGFYSKWAFWRMQESAYSHTGNRSSVSIRVFISWLSPYYEQHKKIPVAILKRKQDK